MSNVALTPKKNIESSFRTRLVRAEDIETLSAVATRAYLDHFTHLWEDSGKAYAEKSFNIKELAVQLRDENNIFYLAFIDNAAVGFLKLRPNNRPALLASVDAFEIERIYLISEVKGKGIGKAMMKQAIDMAREMQKETVWLKVMDSNPQTIGFYESCGFEIIATEALDLPFLKKELSGMFVMTKNLRKQG